MRFEEILRFGKQRRSVRRNGLSARSSMLRSVPKEAAGIPGLFQANTDSLARFFYVAPDLSAEEIACDQPPRSVIRASNGNPDTYSGSVPRALAIRLPDTFEQAASGKKIRLTVVARAAHQAESADFSASYSTNEVGNSGWIKHSVRPQFEAKSLEWAVPPMKDGLGDFIGILPASLGQTGIEIASVEVEVLTDSLSAGKA